MKATARPASQPGAPASRRGGGGGRRREMKGSGRRRGSRNRQLACIYARTPARPPNFLGGRRTAGAGVVGRAVAGGMTREQPPSRCSVGVVGSAAALLISLAIDIPSRRWPCLKKVRAYCSVECVHQSCLKLRQRFHLRVPAPCGCATQAARTARHAMVGIAQQRQLYDTNKPGIIIEKTKKRRQAPNRGTSYGKLWGDADAVQQRFSEQREDRRQREKLILCRCSSFRT